MKSKRIQKDFFGMYKEADSFSRLEIMLSNYERFPKMITVAEKKIKLFIKADYENIRSQGKEELGVRIQTSNLNDSTYDEAVSNIEIERVISQCDTESRIITKLDESDIYKKDIRIIKGMKDSYELLTSVVDGLEVDARLLLQDYFIEKRCLKELAEKYNLSYEGMKTRVKVLRDDIRIEMIACLEKAMGDEVCN